jgi:hypothetical protein
MKVISCDIVMNIVKQIRAMQENKAHKLYDMISVLLSKFHGFSDLQYRIIMCLCATI